MHTLRNSALLVPSAIAAALLLTACASDRVGMENLVRHELAMADTPARQSEIAMHKAEIAHCEQMLSTR